MDPDTPRSRFLRFVNRPTDGKRSIANLHAKGYVEGVEMAPAKAVILGEGRGLSGRAGAALIRTDRRLKP